MLLAESGQLAAAETGCGRRFGLIPSRSTRSPSQHPLIACKATVAVRYLSQALALNPSDPDLRYALASAYADSGHTSEAINILNKLVQEKPDSAIAHFNLANVYARGKRFPEAAEEYRIALRLAPENDVARLSLAKALAAIDRFEDALPLLEDCGRKPYDFEAHYLLGMVYRGLGKFDAASRELNAR
jgi:Flp pilus assembly protein TadD